MGIYGVFRTLTRSPTSPRRHPAHSPKRVAKNFGEIWDKPPGKVKLMFEKPAKCAETPSPPSPWAPGFKTKKSPDYGGGGKTTPETQTCPNFFRLTLPGGSRQHPTQGPKSQCPSSQPVAKRGFTPGSGAYTKVYRKNLKGKKNRQEKKGGAPRGFLITPKKKTLSWPPVF